MLVLCELLSLADHEFVTEAKEQFIAINTSMSGEITFTEFDQAMKQVHPEEEKTDHTRELFEIINRGKNEESLAWSDF